MANMIPLMQYLQDSPPAIPLGSVNPGPNTTNTAYGANNIQHVGIWTNFNLATIRQRYQTLLATTRLQPDPFPASPPQAINVEGLLRDHITEMLRPRIRRALRAGFHQLHASNLLNGLTPVSFSRGEAAATPNGYKPDIAYFIDASNPGSGPNRAPGDVKPSWKWSTAYRTGTPSQQREFRQVLSQVNWYMKQHISRYGVVITDLEMVAIRRLDDNGNLELSAPISWETHGTAQQPRLTIMLALWYLGMLAAQDQGHDRWSMS
ncbi:hypothetical protein AJ78_08933 [Emergomyces pasteurianus Ep9510]|uniref:Fungal-type protein kinase domain-containing protein n=1 Tax=Emergomyces pasteurianus Ep9510 TaxID=1447872 RepID=A0A1J9NYU5_9EURO|nr:hypothetical protein AJ78_08933 [Emergomyces pasteurianus Ep9510]